MTQTAKPLNYSLKMEKSAAPLKMMMVLLLALLCCISLAPAPASAQGEGPAAVERWFRIHYPFPSVARKLTKIRFYYHENRVADVPTAVEVARANITASSPTSFGSTLVFDDPLTLTSDPNSQLLGRAQGQYSSASQTEPAFLLQMSLAFTDGIYKGSTLSAIGRDSITKEFREMSILGGTGIFRLARGTISTHTVALDQATYNAIVEYNAFIEHF